MLESLKFLFSNFHLKNTNKNGKFENFNFKSSTSKEVNFEFENLHKNKSLQLTRLALIFEFPT